MVKQFGNLNNLLLFHYVIQIKLAAKTTSAGHHILDLVHIKPEEVFYLLLVGELPNKDELEEFSNSSFKLSIVSEQRLLNIDS